MKCWHWANIFCSCVTNFEGRKKTANYVTTSSTWTRVLHKISITNGGDTQSRNLRKKVAQVFCASFLHQIFVQVHASSADDTSNKNWRFWTKQITFSILSVDRLNGTQKLYLNNLNNFKKLIRRHTILTLYNKLSTTSTQQNENSGSDRQPTNQSSPF